MREPPIVLLLATEDCAVFCASENDVFTLDIPVEFTESGGDVNNTLPFPASTITAIN